MKFPFAVVCLLFLTTVVTESNALMSSFNACTFCKNVTGELEKSLENKNLTVDQIGQTLGDYCETLSGAAAKTCLNFVSEVIGLYVYACSAGTSDLDGFCAGTMQCPFAELQLFIQPGIFQSRCDICKRTITNMVNNLSGVKTIGASARVIATFCPGSGTITEKVECVIAASQDIETAYGMTQMFLIPEPYCKTTGMCMMSVK